MQKKQKKEEGVRVLGGALPWKRARPGPGGWGKQRGPVIASVLLVPGKLGGDSAQTLHCASISGNGGGRLGESRRGGARAQDQRGRGRDPKPAC